jgi:cyclomaltodextrinase
MLAHAIYQIYVDAFARGSSGRSPGRRHGGDLEGVLERLDHVAALNATAIWLTPIFPSPSDHGYNLTDYFRIDPRLAPPGPDGAAEELFAALVEGAHRRGLAVLLDLPLNHVGHDYDLDRVGPSHTPRVREARTRQERGWSRDLKYFDHDDDATRRFLFDVARYWVEQFGVDGYRYDYVHGVANPFWEALYRELRTLRDDIFVVGEHWEDVGSPEENARDIAARFDGGGGRCFDTLFDFPFQAAASEGLAGESPHALVEILDLCDSIYPREACAMLDNHDTARVGDWLDGDTRRLGVALRLLITRTGPISLLYGTETGLRAGHPPRRPVDESSRIPMAWDRLDTELVELTSRLLALRRAEAALARGSVVARSAVGPLLVERRDGVDGSELVVAVNFSGAEVAVGADLSAAFSGSLAAAALCGGDAIRIEAGRLAAPIPPYGGGIYRGSSAS